MVKKNLTILLLLGMFLISFASTFEAEVILNSPENNSVGYNSNILFNASANVTGGATLNNMSLWTNETGTWGLRQTKFGYVWEDADIISYYKLDNTTGVVYDMTGNHDGTNINAVRGQDGVIGTAFNFTGTSSQAVTTDISLAGRTSASFSFWMKAPPIGNRWVMGKGKAGENPPQDFYISSSKMRFSYSQQASGGSIVTITSTSNVDDSAWHHVVGVLDGDADLLKLYIDGVNEINGSGATFSMFDNGETYDLGRVATSYYTGQLDEIAILNRALTDQEVSVLYASGSGSRSLLGTSSTQTWNRTLTGTTMWNVQACDSDNDCGFATSNYTINLDSTPPSIIISSPNGINFSLDYHNPSYPEIDLNWTISDVNLDSCWYEYNETNTTVICLDNYTTFRADDQTNITLWANDTMGNINFSTSFWNYGFLVENETTFTDNCADSEINWTNLPDGTYEYNVTTCNIYEYCNNTETRIVNLDTTYPLIEYASNSQEDNKSADFSIQDWIFVNTSLYDFNEKNITFILWTSDGIQNETTYTLGGNTGVIDDYSSSINWTNLPNKTMYYWNVTFCDLASNCNTTETRNYGEEIINSSISLEFNNRLSELGGSILVNATNTLNYICVDVDHPDYGINYSCGYWNTLFNISIDYFKKNYFSDGDISKVLSFSGIENKTIIINSHQYDEVDGISMNITGIDESGYPQNLIIYEVNSSNIDRWYPGNMTGDYIYQKTTYDGNGTQNITFTAPGEITKYFWMDDAAELIKLAFNITGYLYGFSWIDSSPSYLEYWDNATSTAHIKGGYITPKGTDPLSFFYDDFEDSNINDVLWTIEIPNGNYNSGSDGGFDFTVDNKEENGYIEIGIDNFMENITSDQTGSATVNNVIYPNYTQINVWSSDEFLFDFNYSSIGNEIQDSNKCQFRHYIDIGTKEIWQSQLDHCVDDRGATLYNCEESSQTIETLIFNVSKQDNSTWLVKITGVERTYGEYQISSSTDCGYFTKIYNWTSGMYTLDYSDNTDPGCEDSNGTMESIGLYNEYYLEGVNYNTVTQLYFDQYVYGIYDDQNSEGCEQIDTWSRMSYLNQTLLNRSNGTAITNELYDSPAEIPSSKFYIGAIGGPNYAAYYLFSSANGGVNWENVQNEVEHVFDNKGTNLKSRIDINLTNEGYLNNTPFIYYVNSSIPESYPSNLDFYFGNDGISDFNITGEVNESSEIEIIINSSNLTSSFLGDPYYGNHLYAVPLTIESETSGGIQISDINLSYYFNKITLNSTKIQEYLDNHGENETNFDIIISSNGGNATIDDLAYNYAGGNDTIEVLAHNMDYSKNLTRNITYYYSRWDYEFVPNYVNFLEFIPLSPTSKNVTPYGQTTETSILNLTNYGYSNIKTNLSIYINDSLDCVNLTMSLTSNKSDGLLLNESWIDLEDNRSYLSTSNIWMWADYNCGYSNWRYFNPYIYFRQCCEGCICSEDLL